MIPVLFKEDEQVFTHNGIGALYESLSCDVIEEENGAFTMELEYPVDGEWFSEIKDFRIIQAKPNDIDDPHNFRIYEIEKSIDELTVFVRANTRTNDLGNNLITNYKGIDVTPQQAMNGIKNNLIEGTNFDLISDIQTKSNVEWTRVNPLNAIVGTRGSLVDIWGGELKRTNTAIHLYSRRGRDNVVTIRPGKNIEGLNMTVSTAGLVTKILPTFSYRPVDVPKYQMVTNSDGTKEKRRVQTSGSTTLRDDITVLGDVVSSQYVDNYPTNYWSSVDYGDDDELKNTVDDYIDARLTHAEEAPGIVDMSGFNKELNDFVKTELDKRAVQYFTHRNPRVDKPTVRITVNMLQLSDSPDWEEFKDLERIGLTDTLDVWVEEYDIDVEVRVTSLTYESIAEEVTSFNAGSDRAPRQSAIEKKYDDLTKATNDYITSFKNGVQNILRNTADGLNRKFEGYTEPPAEISSEGDIWFKEIGEGKVEIWIHDGTYWQPLMTEDFGDKLLADIEATQAELEEAKQQAKSDTDQALEDAKAHAEAEDARIRGELESDIGGAIGLAEQAKQDAIDKANQALIDAKAHAEAEDARIIQEIGLEVDGVIEIAEQAKADAVTKANQALTDAKAYADAEIALIETHFDDIIEGVESDVADAKQTADDAIYKIDNDIANKFTSLDTEILSIETISNSAQANAQTALNQSLEALGDAGTALDNAQTALNQSQDALGDASTALTNSQTALNQSQDALGDADTALTNAQTALNRADTAIGSASNAATLAGNALTKADEAQDAATILSGQVSGFETTMAGFNQTVNNYEGQVSGFRNDILGLESTVANYETEVDEFGNTVSTYATEVNTMRNTVSGFESTVATYGQEVNSLTGEVTTYATQVSEFENTVDGLNSTVSGYRTDVLGYEDEVTLYKNQVSTLNNTVDGFNSTVANYTTQLDEFGNTVDTYATEVSTMRNTVSGFESTVATYGQEVSSLTGEVSTYATQVSNFSNTVDGLNSTVASYETELDEFGDIVDTYASQVSNFSNTVDGLESTVATYGTEVSDLAGEVVGYKNQVSTLNNTVSGFNSTVATYATEVDGFGSEVASYATEVSTMRNTVSGFESTVATYGTQVSGLAGEVVGYKNQVSTLNNTVNGFNSVVTQVQYDLDNIEIGGRNLITKSDPLYAWTGQHNVPNNTGAFVWTRSPHYPAMYQIEVKAIDDSIVGAKFGWQWSGAIQGKSVILSKEWQKATTFVEGSLNIGLRVTGGLGRIELRHIKVENGTIATDWTPAPEDMATSTQVSTLTNTVDGFQSKVDKVEQDYAGVSGTVATHTTQIGTLNGQIALKANTTTVNTLTGRVTTAETGITANANAIALKASTTSVNTLTGRVTTAETGITANSKAIALKASTASVNTLTGRVSTAETSITANADAIALKASTTDVSELTGRVDTAETSITANANAIKLKAATTTVNTLTGRVKTAETNITANADAIKLKASTTAVNTLTGRVSTAESSITANATAITQRLTTTQVNTLVDGKGFAKETSVSTRFNDIQSTVDGTTQTIATLRTDVNGKATTAQFNTLNSTVNGTITRVGTAEGKITTIETNVSGLQTTVATKAAQSQVTQLATGLSSVVTDLSNLEIGGRNLIIRNTETPNTWIGIDGSLGTAANHGTSDYIKVEPNTEYMLTKSNSSLASDAGFFRWGWYNTNKTFIGRTANSNNEIPWKTPSNVHYVRVSYPTDSSPKFEKGNRATDWSPAPEDTQSQITQNATNINLRVSKNDVVNQINVSTEGILISGSKVHITGTTTIDTGVIKNAHIGTLDAAKINTGTIKAARLDSKAIVTAGLTANVIKSTHIETSTATVDKIFATDVMINRLTAKTAFISSVKAVDIDAARITTGTINAARLNASAIVTAGLTANVVKSTHIETSTATVNKIFATDAMITTLTAKTAFITSVKAVDIDAARITSGTINAARLNASAIVTAGLTANVVKSTHISADTALFDMLFSTASATDRLSARTAWIKTANISNSSITNAKIADATIASAKIASLDVNKLSGNKGTWIMNEFNSAQSTLSITGDGISIGQTNGSRSARLTERGYEFWRDGSEHGLMYTLKATDVHEQFAGKHNVSLAAEPDAYISLSVRNDLGVWSKSLSVMGDTGEVGIHRTLNMWANDINRIRALRFIYSQGNVIASGEDTIMRHTFSTSIRFNYAPDQQVFEIDRTGIHSYGITRLHSAVAMNSNHINSLGMVTFDRQPENNRFYTNSLDQLHLGFHTRLRVMHGGSEVMGYTGERTYSYRNINMDGNSITNQSDERLKRDIKSTEINSLKIIEDLRIVGFNWKDDDKNKRLGRQMGIIAQESPHLAMYDVTTDTWSINSSKQIMINSHAIQQLSLMEENTNKVASQALQLVENNKSEIDELREENKDLRSRIEELESVI